MARVRVGVGLEVSAVLGGWLRKVSEAVVVSFRGAGRSGAEMVDVSIALVTVSLVLSAGVSRAVSVTSL